jgi:hypothetical protein
MVEPPRFASRQPGAGGSQIFTTLIEIVNSTGSKDRLGFPGTSAMLARISEWKYVDVAGARMCLTPR